MARITVEDCLKRINSQYDLVLLAKERTIQLNAGQPSLVPQDNDKNTVIALREIGEGKVSIGTLEETAINKLRKQQEGITELEEVDEGHDDDFDKIYKGEISKSGTAILPSKRVKRILEKSNFEDKNLNDKSDGKDAETKKQEELESLPSDIKSEK